MKFKLKLLAAAAMVALAAGSAQAALSLPSSGNGSLTFVAIDSTGSPISLAVDLGYAMSDFIPATSTFNSAGTTIVWDFGHNTRTVNGIASVGDFAWSAGLSSFLGTAQASELTWGVVAGDSVNGGTIAGRGWLSSGNATAAQMQAMSTSGPVGNGLSAINPWSVAVNNTGTHVTNADGAGTASSGSAYLGTAMGGNFNNQQTWSYLTADNVASTFQYLQQVVANPTVTQIGVISTIDSLSPSPSKFLFNAQAGTLTYAVAAVPEPSTYAMLIAGLAAIGTMVRRRRS